VGTYAIIKPISRCADEDGPVVGVVAIVVFVEETTGLFFLSGSQGLEEPE